MSGSATLVLLDVNFDPEGLKLAWDGDVLVAAAYAVRRRNAAVGADLEEGRGWVPFFFVAPHWHGAGVGRAVFAAALEWLRGQRVREVFFSSYTPNYVLPGVDGAAYPGGARWLEGLGFVRQYTAAAMDRSLVGYAGAGAGSRAVRRAGRAGLVRGDPGGG